MENHPPRPAQTAVLIELLARLVKQYNIPLENILGHREVPGAKTLCPGNHFPLEEVRARLAEAVSGKGCSGLWLVQAGAFIDRKRAEDYAHNLREHGIDAFVVQK